MFTTTAVAAGSYHAGDLVPLTETFVQSSGGSPITTGIVLVGQILNNGQTNFVGYDNGQAEYLLTTSKSGAKQTMLADGNTYYVSSGSAPAGYLATGGSESEDGATMTSSSGDSSAQESASASDSSTAESSIAGASSSGTISAASSSSQAAAAQTSSQSTAHILSLAPVLTLAVGFVALTVAYLA